MTRASSKSATNIGVICICLYGIMSLYLLLLLCHVVLHTLFKIN